MISMNGKMVLKAELSHTCPSAPGERGRLILLCVKLIALYVKLQGVRGSGSVGT